MPGTAPVPRTAFLQRLFPEVASFDRLNQEQRFENRDYLRLSIIKRPHQEQNRAIGV
jgi:hypothetical protein